MMMNVIINPIGGESSLLRDERLLASFAIQLNAGPMFFGGSLRATL
jgi:hypothetical protein